MSPSAACPCLILTLFLSFAWTPLTQTETARFLVASCRGEGAFTLWSFTPYDYTFQLRQQFEKDEFSAKDTG